MPTLIGSVSVLESVKRAIVVYAMTGRPIMLTGTNELDSMSLGFAHVQITERFTSIIDEPLVIQAAFNFFEQNPNSLWLQLMTQVNFNASMLGFVWKKCVVNLLRQKLFESNTALSESGLFLMKKGKQKVVKYQYLPEDFERPPRCYHMVINV